MVKFQTLCRSAIVIWIWNGFSALGTVYHSDGSVASVQGLQNQVVNGDTITIPAGTFTWRTRVTISKSITLQGAGVGQSIIKDAVNGTPLIQVGLVANKLTRITGIEFQDGGRASNQLGVLQFVGSNTDGSRLRMDHCKVNDLNGMVVADTVIGVMDHNTFIRATKNGSSVVIYDNNWNGRTNGDGSWADTTQFGSDRFLFLEDNVFQNNGDDQPGITDAYAGARFVVRHNQIFDRTVQTHGTETTGRPRGARAVEVYNNTFTGSDRNRFLGGMRSGILLFHDNAISGYGQPRRSSLCSATVPWIRSTRGAAPTDTVGYKQRRHRFRDRTAPEGYHTVSVSGRPTG